MIPHCEILIGDVRAKLLELKKRKTKVQTIVTSPPYWALRAYGTTPQIWGGKKKCAHEWGPENPAVERDRQHVDVAVGAAGGGRKYSESNEHYPTTHGAFCRHCRAWLGELGLEPTPALFIKHTVEVFRYVWDVLADDGTLWVNIGDTYVGNAGGYSGLESMGATGNLRISKKTLGAVIKGAKNKPQPGLKQKDLVGIPWMLAFALRADGWYLRQDIIWHKPSPMPESVKDRCTKAHEYVFLLTKSPTYYYDADAIKEPSSPNSHRRYARGRSTDHKWADGGPGDQTIAKSFAHMTGRHDGMNGVNPKAKAVGGWDPDPSGSHLASDFAKPGAGTNETKFPRPKQNESFSAAVEDLVEMRNKRSVWTIAAEGYAGAHYATFPKDLVRPCILAGSKKGDTVLDIFGGSGTVGVVANEYGRNAILIDLNPINEQLMRERLSEHAGQGVLL